MIGQETIDSAIKWCDIGQRWIENSAVKLGLEYLDRAISVFNEGGERAWLTYAQHRKMEGLRLARREEEAIALFEVVMAGYERMGDGYGKALLLAHLGESYASQGRAERALAALNLAASVAGAAGLEKVLAHILGLQGELYLQRENLLQAIRLFRKAEALTEQEGYDKPSLALRFRAAAAMVRLGERADATALLEDQQTRLVRGLFFREAMEPLTLLSRLYEESGAWDEKNRITQLIHLCGQKLTATDGEPRKRNEALPEILPFRPSA
ncbi:MAG: hypothetical protein V3S29_11140 [bacterium]